MAKYIFLLAIIPFHAFCKITPDSLLNLDLQHKNLSKLPTTINYATLNALHIGYNPIKTIPSDLVLAKNLKSLSINFDRQFDIETSIATIKKLKLESLSINSSNLMYLPLEFGDIKGLQDLSLSNNYIKEIPAYVFLNSNFIKLNLSGNYILNIPKEINSQTQLTFLDISKNPCINDATTYSNLSSNTLLTDLQVRGATNLPQSIWNLKSAQKIDISEGLFTKLNLPEDAHKNNLIQLTASDCHALDFETLLPLLASQGLKEITLGGTNFTGFSNASISNATEKLILKGDHLTHFSFSNSLPNLTDLILNFNTITCQTELLTTILKCQNLKNLNLSNCNVTQLPVQLSSLKGLETLDLTGNKINSITELLKLKSLVTLDVSSCELTTEQVEKLTKELPNTTVICNTATAKLPLPNAAPKTENFVVSPSDPQKIVTENGTTITIPKNSLVYENGKPVKEPVTINYTPYYSLTDIASSGINMNYQDKETNAPFTSAGMFNISANANGQNVALKKGSEMTIAFKSNDPEQSYNYYAYDSIKQTWKTIGKDTITKVKVAKQEDTTTRVNNSTANFQMPQMPQPGMFYKFHEIRINWDLDNHKKLTGKFSIQTEVSSSKIEKDTAVNDNYYSELKALTRLRWHIDAEKSSNVVKAFFKENKLFNNEAERRMFHLKPRHYTSKTQVAKNVEFDLLVDREHDNFVFTFYSETDTISFSAYPIIDNRSTDRTQKSIKKMYASYESAAKERKKLSRYRKEKFEAAYRQFKLNLSAMRALAIANSEKSIANLLNEKVNTNSYDVTRLLSMQGFGIYNCDRPIIVENALAFTPNFFNENGKKLSKDRFQVIDPKENIVVSYYSIQKIKVSKNSIITFIYTKSNGNSSSVYVGKLNTFDIASKNGEIDVQLSAIDKNLTHADLNAYITSTY